MFGINAAFVTTAILYSAFWLKVNQIVTILKPLSISLETLIQKNFDLFFFLNFLPNSGEHHYDKHPYVKWMAALEWLVTFSTAST